MRSSMQRAVFVIAVAFVCGTTSGLRAQVTDPAIAVTASFAAAEYVASNASISLTLSRWPTHSEGRLAVMIGSQDMSALFDRIGTQLVFRGRGFTLPSGEQTV